jgi:hypothetical protein
MAKVQLLRMLSSANAAELIDRIAAMLAYAGLPDLAP